MTVPVAIPVPVPIGADLLKFVGWPITPDLLAQASQHVAIVTAVVRSYTRGRGFAVGGAVCDEAVSAVILSAGARSLDNPAQARRVEAGSYNAVPGSFAGFTLVETLLLNNFRKTAG